MYRISIKPVKPLNFLKISYFFLYFINFRVFYSRVACIAGNRTEALQAITNGLADSAEAGITIDSGPLVASAIFKSVKNYARGDVMSYVQHPEYAKLPPI